MTATLYVAPVLFVAGLANTAHAQEVTRYAPSVAQPPAARVAYLRASMGSTYTLGYEYRCARIGADGVQRPAALSGRLLL
jgi:hypothetical protein